MRFVNINEYFGVDYVNVTCTLEDDPADPITSHPTRQGQYAVLDDDDRLIDYACIPHYERLAV